VCRARGRPVRPVTSGWVRSRSTCCGPAPGSGTRMYTAGNSTEGSSSWLMRKELATPAPIRIRAKRITTGRLFRHQRTIVYKIRAPYPGLQRAVLRRYSARTLCRIYGGSVKLCQLLQEALELRHLLMIVYTEPGHAQGETVGVLAPALQTRSKRI